MAFKYIQIVYYQ